MIRLSLGLFIVGITLMGCKENRQQEVSNTTAESQEKVVVNKKKFIEGALVYKMSLSDSLLNQFIVHISHDPLYSKELANKYLAELSVEDRDRVKQFLTENPQILKEYGRLPFIKNNVYVAGYEVVYKAEGATYLLENKWNDILDEGFVYATSTIVPNTALNFSYQKDFLEKEHWHTHITLDDYTRVTSDEVSMVAGYEVEKIIYTLKKNSKKNNLPKSLIVYTSILFNPVINKVQPYCLNEEGGILKLEVEMPSVPQSMNMVYEAEMIVGRKLLEQETAIVATKAFYGTKTNDDLAKLKERLSKIFVVPSI
ncbi:hypothetical protein HX045_08695 [Myroides odoratimimus]|uniref:Lipoprotein n=2 Tax=Myroides odoratimimus TaxID=76832 RepID=A0AAI8C5T7_9FLAO|nr:MULTISPECIES: hypothetical protein [Myroides]ALU26684.1 hypothetical protein AS202_11230 [Myroides odoratimimus]APA92699.1 hypothetical protein BK054_10830 [Myroides sp. ZB35]EHO13661.1 hypothetical protein HMPREF9715_01199 [Myroides odoratimimus CIP 101113]MCO7724685.1 hypothetical protein [Myroides odoratimimus]MDM1035048.1 hypothetical protein [Myroides odoratimimus]